MTKNDFDTDVKRIQSAIDLAHLWHAITFGAMDAEYKALKERILLEQEKRHAKDDQQTTNRETTKNSGG